MAQNAVQYEDDFYAWTIEQARLLRAGELSAVDAANVAEEIESMGRSDRCELQSRLMALTMHLSEMAPATGSAFPELVGDNRRATVADRPSIWGIAEPAAIGRRDAAACVRDRSCPSDRRNRSCRRCVFPNLPLYPRRNSLALFSARAVTAQSRCRSAAELLGPRRQATQPAK